MRGKKTLELKERKKTIEVYELTFKEIKDLFELNDLPGSDFEALLSHFGGKILPMVTNLSMEELEDFAPSEAKEVWDAVQEVNAVFFDIVKASGVQEFLTRFKDAVLSDCLSYAATSLNAAIAKSGTTGTPISSEP